MERRRRYIRECQRRIKKMEANLIREITIAQERAANGPASTEIKKLLNCMERTLEALRGTSATLLLEQTIRPPDQADNANRFSRRSPKVS